MVFLALDFKVVEQWIFFWRQFLRQIDDEPHVADGVPPWGIGGLEVRGPTPAGIGKLR